MDFISDYLNKIFVCLFVDFSFLASMNSTLVMDSQEHGTDKSGKLEAFVCVVLKL